MIAELRTALEALLAEQDVPLRRDSEESAPGLDDYPYVVLRLSVQHLSDRVCRATSLADVMAYTVRVGLSEEDSDELGDRVALALTGKRVGAASQSGVIEHYATNPVGPDKDLADRTVLSGQDIWRFVRT